MLKSSRNRLFASVHLQQSWMPACYPPLKLTRRKFFQTPFVQALPETYTSEATQGPLLCDIAYPMDAPGYAHDPTANPADVGLAATLWHQGPSQFAQHHC